MRKTPLVVVLAVLVFAASAAGAGPPPLPAGAPVGPPFMLPTPKPGGAVFAAITATGTLAPGAAHPSVIPVGMGPFTPTLRIASAQTAPVTADGKTKITFYFAIGDVSKPAPRRAAVALRGFGNEIGGDFFGTPSYWLSPLRSSPYTTLDCHYLGHIVQRLKSLRVVYGNPGDTAIEMWKGAWTRAGCKGNLDIS